ncbi:MAG TPA: chromate efflux transporter [Candidatus Acidoferrum sp.]|jgi:chromate transporter
MSVEDNSNLERAPGTIGEIAKEFLRLGFVAFGGPAAHFPMMEERFVQREEWLTRERFIDLMGAASLLPGPSSTEMAIYLGELRGGIPGLLVAGACFILPAAMLVVLLAWAYVRFGSVSQVEGLLFGIKPVVIALIAQPMWSLARTALKSVPLTILAVAIVVFSALGYPVLVLLLGAGVLWMMLMQGRQLLRKEIALAGIGGFASLGATGIASVVPVFLYFLKVGAVLFGSGYVLLAVLRADLVVDRHWLTDGQLLDAIAVSQATPGPFFTVATFIGYILCGWRGAVLGTIGMFLPAFVYVGMTAHILPKLRKSPLAGAFLDGVNAAAVALMVFVGFQFARATLINIPAIVLAAVSMLLVFRYKVNSAWLVLGGAITGILLRTLGWA